MAPVGDAVGLVHHQHPGGGGQLGQDQIPEARVVQPLRADQQQVDRARGDLRVDAVPVADVGRVHRAGLQAGPGRRLDLVAHEGQQRRDDDGRPHAAGPQQRCGDEVDRRLSPAGALHDQRPAALGDERLDGGPLILAEPGRRPGQGAQAALRVLAHRVHGCARLMPWVPWYHQPRTSMTRPALAPASGPCRLRSNVDDFRCGHSG